MTKGVAFDLEAAKRETLENYRKYNSQILSVAREPKDLVAKISQCRIEDVAFDVSSIEHTPHSEMTMGGRSPVYSMGNSFSAIISLDHPVLTKVTILGWPNLERGDRVDVYVFKGKEVELHSLDGVVPYPEGENRTLPFIAGDYEKINVWHEDNLINQMRAIKIEKLGADFKVLARYKDLSLCKLYGLE